MNLLTRRTLKALTVSVTVGVVFTLLCGFADVATGIAIGGLLFAVMLKLRVRILERFGESGSVSLPVKYSLLRHGLLLAVLCIVAASVGLLAAVVAVVMQVLGNILLVLSALKESARTE